MFRFTIRDVLWLVLVVALALSWQIERRFAGKRLEAVEDERDRAITNEKIWKVTAKRNEQRLLYALNPPALDALLLDYGLPCGST
jgi:hypothetical protein